MDFSNINTNNKGTAALLGALKKTSLAKTDYSREDEWSISKDKEGNGAAVIRFVKSKDGHYFQEVRSHGYQSPATGRWYIENCPKTLDWDNNCPVCEHAQTLMGGRDYKKLPKSEQDKIRPFFANTSYWSTILVETDTANPENEGKLFKYRFGKKILEKIVGRAADDPLDDSIKGIDVFDVQDGASFKLIVSKVAGYPNYDTSSFKNPAPLLGGDADAIDALLEGNHEIGYMTSKDNIKEYGDLKKKFYSILGTNPPGHSSADQIEDTEIEKDNTGIEDTSSDLEDTTDTSSDTTLDSGDDDLDYFESLSSEDV